MFSLKKFINFLKISPPSGLVIREKGLAVGQVLEELGNLGISYIKLEIGEKSTSGDFFNVMDEALKQKSWLILDIKTPDIPPWLYEELRTLAGSGHVYDRQDNKDTALYNEDTRVLAVMSWKDMETSPFETLLSNFGVVYRPE